MSRSPEQSIAWGRLLTRVLKTGIEGLPMYMKSVSRLNVSSSSAFLLFASIFAISYTQSPLYSSNQNTYFLHGLANGGFGNLSHDWMGNTTDPFPAFSFLVALTYSDLPAFSFYIYYAVILGIFIYSIMGINSIAWGINRSCREYITYFVIVTIICSAAFNSLWLQVTGINLASVFQGGLAGQYMLGPVFQPSTFGVFLLLSIYLFLRNNPVVSVFFLGVAASFHSSYLLSAAALALSYMAVALLEEKNYRKALFIGFLGTIAVMPVVAYAYSAFAPTSPEAMAQAQRILVDYRIPQHAKVGNWFDMKALFQIGVIVSALFVLKKKTLRLILFIPFLVGFFLTLIQVSTDNKFLALLFPWRVSSVLVPLSTFVLIGRGVSLIFQKYQETIIKHRKAIDLSIVMALAFLFLSGILISYMKFMRHNKEDFIPVMNFVRATKSKSDVYLIPTDLERFRLYTGAPIFVDFKTHPYRDIEVIDWNDRIQLANRFFGGTGESRCRVLREIASRYEVTHVISQDDLADCDRLEKTFEDEKYSLYKIE
jgi:hypothetical protein